MSGWGFGEMEVGRYVIGHGIYDCYCGFSSQGFLS